MASAAMASSATAQHNLLALQTQLLALQSENATLTKALSLKENYVLQKEQQLRVLQQRLEDLEGGVATWKDRYLQQLHALDTGDAPVRASGDWTALPLPAPSGAQELPNADAMGALVDKLSTADREKLKALIGMERTRDPAQARAPWEEAFLDVSDELQSVLLQYLLPVLLETQRIENQRAAADGATMAIHCLARRYAKPATDFKIVCQLLPRQEKESEETTAAVKTEAPTVSTAATTAQRGSYSTSSTTAASSATASTSASSTSSAAATATSSSVSLAAAAAAAAERLPAAEEHLFDCVECDGSKRTAAPVSHGPREIHPSKAVYISRPIAQQPTSPSRRYTLGPKSSSSSSADSLRTTTMSGGSITGYPSFGSTRRSDHSYSESIDADRRSGASSNSLTGSLPGSGSSKDSGKIKKIMGSVMKGLNRHKPQLTTTNPQMEEDDSVCDGCGRGPITGVKWICRTCKILKEQEYELCEKCYGQGLHGKENEDALFERIEEIVVAKCPKLAREQDLMKLLRVGICKANLKKYSFCLTWIADLLLCKATKDLRARALEISQISPQVRSEFVRLLTELLTKHRRDIELITEWQPVQNVSAASGGSGDGTTMLQLDTLRIWVKDAVVDGTG